MDRKSDSWSTVCMLLIFCLCLNAIVAQSTCPSDFGSQWEHSCYYASSISTPDWSGAKSLCDNKHGSQLLVIDDDKENKHVTDANLITGNTWLGCEYSSSSSKWICGSPSSDMTFFNWQGGAVNILQNPGHYCAQITNNGEFAVQTCANNNRFICELKLQNDATTRTYTDVKTTVHMTTTVQSITTDAGETSTTSQSSTPTNVVTNPASTHDQHEESTTIITTKLAVESSPTNSQLITNPNTNIGLAMFRAEIEGLLKSGFSWDGYTTERNVEGVNWLESAEYAFLSSSISTTHEFDIPVEGSVYHVAFPRTSNELSKASFVSIGIPKNSNQIEFKEDNVEADTVSTTYALGSHVVSISLYDEDSNVIDYDSDVNPVEIIFHISQQRPIGATPVCSYYDVEKKIWSTKGCELKFDNASQVACNVYHLSSFAVLMQVVDVEIPTENTVAREALGYLTKIFLAVSITCLILTLVVFGVFRMYKKPRIIIHSNLAISLLICYLVMIAGTPKTTVACKAVAVMLHYFYLVAFMWMLFEGVHLYLKVSPTIKLTMRMPVCMGVAWGVPLLIAIVCIAVRHDVYGTNCFLPVQYGVIAAFIIPVFCVILINILILIATVKTFMALKANQDKTETQRVRALLRAMLILVPLLGTTWIFGLLIQFNHSSTIVFIYLFDICNSLQGALIFLTQCLMDDEVKKCFKQRFGRVGTGGDSRSKSSNASADTRDTT